MYYIGHGMGTPTDESDHQLWWLGNRPGTLSDHGSNNTLQGQSSVMDYDRSWLGSLFLVYICLHCEPQI